MKKIFNYVVDINNAQQKYPSNADGAVFFMSDDSRFFLYALYTRRDRTCPALIELSADAYDSQINLYKDTHLKDPSIIYLPSVEAIHGIVKFVHYKAHVDNTPLEDLFNLNYKGD